MVTQKHRESARQLYMGRIIAAFILAIILFSSVFMFGYIVSRERYDQNFYEQQRILRSYLTIQVEKNLLKTSCSPEAILASSKSLDELGVFITLLEEKLGFDDEFLKEQKNDYYLLEAEHMTLVQEQNEQCENKSDVVLFFYSNEEAYVDRAEEIGFILLTAKNEAESREESVLIYSFDYDADYSLVEILKDAYGVTRPNDVVVNGNVVDSITHISDIEQALDEHTVQKETIIHLN